MKVTDLPQHAGRKTCGARTVLVVDDDEAMRALMRVHLLNAGYQVLLAEDAIEAGKLLYRSRPDLMVVDVEMPYMSGLELVSLMQSDRTLGHVPAMLITAQERFSEQAALLGLPCLVKPFFADDFLRLVEISAAQES